MKTELPRLRDQITCLEKLKSACLQHQESSRHVNSELQRVYGAHLELRQQILREHETAARMQDERTALDHRTRCEESANIAAEQMRTIEDERIRSTSELQAQFDAERKSLRLNLENELWVLQSICDETGEDTPAARSVRFSDTIFSQQQFLHETLTALNLRIDNTAKYLTKCHAGTDSRLPKSGPVTLGREECRQHVIDRTTESFRLADQIDGLQLPSWTIGFRLPMVFLLLTLLLILPVAAVKTDIRSYFSPETGNPDWGWLGVSCLISIASAMLVTAVLVVTVQQKLRSRFQLMLQDAADAQAASVRWESLSRKESDRLRKSAELWKIQLVEQREKRTVVLQAAHDVRLAALQQQLQNQLAEVESHYQNTMSEVTAHQRSQCEAADRWRADTASRVQLERSQKLQSAVAIADTALQRDAASLQTIGQNIVIQWQEDLRRATEYAQQCRDSVRGTRRFPHLTSARWVPPTEMPAAIPAGDFLVALPSVPSPEAPQKESSLCVEMPAVLEFPGDTSIVVEHDASGRDAAVAFVRALVLKLLTTVPPGRIQLTLIDPVGLGESFSALMHLADFDELLIGSRIWTESTQIRERLQKITDHMENVFQTYLRSEFSTIEQYNAAAGEVAEPYHFVVVAGFPVGFSEEAARHLTSILTSGARCGVHTLLTWNVDQAAPRSFDISHLKDQCTGFRVSGGKVIPSSSERLTFEFDALQPPSAADYVRMVRAVGEPSRDARRVEVSFARISPKPDNIWTSSTAEGIELAMGRAGAARLQFLKLGRGTSQHVLIAGKTGSGKSTLLHILITNLALHYSPDEIQFYLIDFKKGVEFRTYAAHHLPHARVIAIESDREFGLSVLERLDEVLQERGELFRGRGVQDVPAFRRQFPGERMPRLILLIDEFQEFFVAEDRVSSRASLLLDRLIRQGRAFGVHVILGSQTLGGAYSLARSTLGQVAVRIALQCSESDAHLILSEDNSAARLLTRPGEAIYNDANGMVEGNHSFQIAWLDETGREQAIQQMLRIPRAKQLRDDSRMIVFEGNVAPTAAQCGPLNAWLRNDADATRKVVEVFPVWLGEPVAIAPPTCVELRRGSGQNLLVVGQDSDMADGILVMAALSCCRPRNPGGITSEAGASVSGGELSAGTDDDITVSDGGTRADQVPELVNRGDNAAPESSLSSTSSPDSAAASDSGEASVRIGDSDGTFSSGIRKVPGAQLILLHDGRDRESLNRFSAIQRQLPGLHLSIHAAAAADNVITDLHSILVSRESVASSAEGPEILLAIRNIGQFRTLRKDDDDFSLGGFGEPKAASSVSRLSDLIKRGPAVGIHLLVWSDTYSNAVRWLSNSLLREFENRIAFRMNQTDSASLVDSPIAAGLGPGRGILYRDQTGTAEKFRPFSWPDAFWLEQVFGGKSTSQRSIEFDIDKINIE